MQADLPAAADAAKPKQRDVLVVSNNWAGTADLIDPHTFNRLKRLDVIPDAEWRPILLFGLLLPWLGALAIAAGIVYGVVRLTLARRS